ncbi:MAG: ribosome-associated translation inhibitor RaiA [Methylacidiphilales bacterium]|nr:ribosome-associated translation inhibitor RaiA [Candidatus Methylacidiphilales bacterium]
MRIDISATSFELTDAIRDFVHKKFTKLEKHSSHLRHLHLILKKEQKTFIAEAVLKFDSHNDIVVETEMQDMYKSIDSTFERVKHKLDRMLDKDHTYR